jgi:hypothetical protein
MYNVTKMDLSEQETKKQREKLAALEKEIPGARITAECPEFMLVVRADGRREVLNQPDFISWELACFNINDRSGKANRLKMAKAMDSFFLSVCEHYEGRRKPELDLGALRDLVEAFGEELLNSVKNSDHKAADSFKKAVQSVVYRHGEKEAKMTSHAIHAASQIFLKTEIRPSKRAIQTAMEAQGLVYRGRNAQNKWSDLFNASGLGDLPE